MEVLTTSWSSVLMILILGFVLLKESTGLPNVLHIGGVFHPESKDHQYIAFQYAVDRINMDRHLLPDTRLVPHSINVSKHDSFNTGRKVCDLTEIGIAAIFGPQSTTSGGIVRSICETLEIPNLQTNWRACPRPDTRCQLNLHPDPDVLAKAYVDVIKFLNWKTFTIVYESNEGLKRLQEILKARSPSDPPIVVRQLGEGTDYRTVLKEIHESSETHIVLDCDTDHLVSILRQAREVNMMGDYESYLLTSLDAHTVDFKEFQYIQTNITTLRLVDPTRLEVQNAIYDWRYGELRYERKLDISPETVKLEAALLYDAVNLFAQALHQLDETNSIHTRPLKCDSANTWQHGFSLRNYMKLMKTQGLTGSISFDDRGRRHDFTLDMVDVSHGAVRRVGSWNSVTGLNHTQTYSEVLTEIQRNIKNKTFIVSSKTGMPYLDWKDPNAMGNERFHGFAKDLIEEIAKLLKFKGYEFKIAPGNKQGSLDTATGKWDGIMKEIIDRKADLGICDFTITYDRGKAVDFTMPFLNTGISILFTKPKKPETELFSFLKPFSFDVWIFMATAYLGVSLILFLLARASPREWGNPHPCNRRPEELENSFNMLTCLWFSIGSLMAQGCDILPKITPYEWNNPHPCNPEPEELENNLTVNNCIWHNLGSLMQQGSDIAPQAVSTRMVAGMWWFFTLIMISSYTANLTAFLTITRMESTIKSAEDLAEQTKIKFGPMRGGSTSSFFSNSNHTLYQRMWAMMQQAKPDVFAESNIEGVERVQKAKGRYAFFMESVSIEYEIERRCELTQINGLLDQKGYGIALPINSPYRSLVSGAVLKLSENGVLGELKNKWWKKNGGGKCDLSGEAEGGANNELTMANVGGMFVVLVVGCCAAFLVAILEFLWNCRKIAVERKITPWEAMVSELKFALNFTETTKPVEKPQEDDYVSRSIIYHNTT